MVAITHNFVSAKGDGTDATLLQPSYWNANHVITFAATQKVAGRNTAGGGAAEEVSTSQLLDWLGTTRGSVLYRGASTWGALGPGLAGQAYTSGGAGADPSWVTPVTALSGIAYDIGAVAGNRNRLINGNFMVDQRACGASFTIVTANGYYGPDRWYYGASGANISGQFIVNAAGTGFRAKLTGAASNTGAVIGQRMERSNTTDLANGVASISMVLAATGITTVNWALFYANSLDNFGTLASPAHTLISNGSFTVNSTEAVYKAQNISIPSGATTGIELVISVNGLTAGQTLTVGDVQLEPGAVATPYERRSYASELQLCQRYYEKSFSTNTVPANGTSDYSGAVSASVISASALGNCLLMTRFKVEKRVAPSLTTYNPRAGGAAGAMTDSSGVDSSTSLANIGTSSVAWYNSGQALTPNAFGYLHFAASAEL